MALEFNQLVTLAKTVARADKSAPVAFSFNEKNYSLDDAQEALRAELNALAGTYSLYRENKNTIFALMEQVIEDVLPKKVLEAYGSFAEIKTFAQGDKPVFRQKITAASKARAKQFIGKVGLAGIYEVFKLDGQSYEIATNAIGGAAQIGFEEFLDGRVDFADVLDVVLMGLDECIYVEIQKQLIGAIENVQTVNKTSQAGFVESAMDNLLQISDAYGAGGKSDIYCTFEFAAEMIPAQGWASNEHKNEIWNNGYIANYKGHKVVVMPQSFTDNTNTTKVIDPKFAWIIPSGAAKPVKIAFEGAACVKEVENYDWSREIHIYKKVGVRAILSPDICVYENTALA